MQLIAPFQWILTIATNHDVLVYGLIIILACAEGPILSVIFGVLVRFTFFPLLPVYASLMIGDLLGDIIWYGIGRRYGHRFISRYGKYFGVAEDKVEKMTKLFHRYKHSVLFISKISNGFGFALVTLMTAGMVRIPFGRYITVNLAGQFIWSGMLLAVGYYFSSAYIQINNWAGRVSLTAAAIVVGFIAYRYFRYLRSKAVRLGE